MSTKYNDLRIKVNRIIFRSEETGYTIFKFNGMFGANFSAKGYFPVIKKDNVIYASGDLVDDGKYGMSFKIESYYEDLPISKNEIKAFLENKMIRGIGPATAKRLVAKFGDQTLKIIECDPQKLTQVKGISPKKAQSFHNELMKRKEIMHIFAYLSSIGISSVYCTRIYNQFKNFTRSIIEENPYRLTEIRGIGFLKADEIAMNMGIKRDSEFRLRAGIEYVQGLTNDGHIYYPTDYLLSQASKELKYNDVERLDSIAHSLTSLVFTQRNGQEAVYLGGVYKKEEKIANILFEKSLQHEKVCLSDARIKTLEKNAGIALHETQREAVSCAVKNSLMVLTGGPGTGKTATTGIIIKALETINSSIALCAPTGRAAKRMSESCGRPASTIHRLLKYDPIAYDFFYNADNKLPYKAILVDEASMIDQALMHSLLIAMKPEAKLILIGDENQLPSVGAGNILADIIASNICPVIRLTKIFRQGEDSEIITNAHHILNNETLNISNKKDFFFIDSNDQMLTQEKVIHYVKESLPKFTGETEIQVLAPMRKGETGVNKMNTVLQEALNPCGEKAGAFRIGDRVIQTRNNYDLVRINNDGDELAGVFNGDVGTITGCFEDEEDSDKDYLVITFDDGYKTYYPLKFQDDLELAYCITIHKSQGSEYPVVVIPISSYIPGFTSMNLIYTAITRAKKYVCVVGSKKVFTWMVKDRRKQHRYTGLEEILKQKQKKFEEERGIY